MEELMKQVDIKKIGNISLIVAIAVGTFYVLQSYKTYLEIKNLKNEQL